MPHHLRRVFIRKKRSAVSREIAPDEIFLDAHNLPALDEHQFEGRLEKPVSSRSIAALGVACLGIGLVFLVRLWGLQVAEGEEYAVASEENRLRHAPVFAERGIVYDRNGVELAWNAPNTTDAFALREYRDAVGLSHTLGFVSYPTRDTAGFFFREDVEGEDGVERVYDEILGGENGVTIIETNALGEVLSQNTIRPPHDGGSVTLAVDARLQSALYEEIETTAESSGFRGGAGVVMDVRTGEIVALTSFPEFKSHVVANESNSEEYESYHENPYAPFLNRAVSGLYTPGSIVKPFLAVAALEEGVIAPHEKILSTGELRVPNPYNSDDVSIFRDWRAHGWVDMRDAIAVSSNVYFYEIGGGFGGREGLGIENIERYMRLFGFGAPTGIVFASEEDGVIPTPAWKREQFGDDPWRLGDTYNTSIGQYGFQVTPLQVVRATASLANGGTLRAPLFRKSDREGDKEGTLFLGVADEHLQIAREGMRRAVTSGIAQGLSVPYVSVAAKTGTAEVGIEKTLINSWVTGFFPYESPRYAFVVLMERGEAGTLFGAVATMRNVLEWMNEHTPEYFQSPRRSRVVSPDTADMSVR